VSEGDARNVAKLLDVSGYDKSTSQSSADRQCSSYGNEAASFSETVVETESPAVASPPGRLDRQESSLVAGEGDR
jgi:hypothetical protein